MEENKKISIIIPVYNSSKYLYDLMNNLNQQTYRNLEIIFVNDGSTDDSKHVLNEIQKNNDNVIIINKNNTGVSDTRNIGINKATGDYIGFLDADDKFSNNMFERLIEEIEKYNADISMCAFYRCINGKKISELFPWSDDIKIFSEKSIIDNLYPLYIGNLKNEKSSIWGTVWRILVRSDLAKKIKFIDNLKIAEDLLYILDLFSISKKVVTINEPLYQYIVYDNSAIGKYKADLDKTNQIFHSELERRLIKINFFDSNKIRYQLNRNLMYTTSLSNIVKEEKIGFIKKRRKIKNIINQFNHDKYIDSNILKELNTERKLVFIMMRCRLYSLITILFQIKEIARKGILKK